MTTSGTADAPGRAAAFNKLTPLGDDAPTTLEHLPLAAAAMSNAPVTGPPKDNPWDEDDTGGRSAVGAVAGAAGSAFTATAGAVGTASGALSNA